MLNSSSVCTFIKCKHASSRSNQKSIERFLEAIRIGPVCICAACNRIFYKSNITSFNKEKQFKNHQQDYYSYKL